MSALRIALAQLNFTVGDIQNNATKMVDAAKRATEHKADLIVFSELALTGYPIEDLLFRGMLHTQVQQAIELLLPHAEKIDMLFGLPMKTEKGYHNAAIWLRKGKVLATFYKQKLPNYSVFDEWRYFIPRAETTTVDLKDHRFGVLICEDLWHQGPIQQLVQAGAKSILCLNASPYSYLKSNLRAKILKTRTEETRVPIFYVNQIGGQDELVFDGDTQVIDAQGHQCAHAGWFEEKLLIVDMSQKGEITQQSFAASMPKLESIYKALVLGTRDYVLKNHFSGVLLGLSGGIDSALVLAIAVDALGADRVMAILMPSQYTASMSNEEAIAEAKTLGVRYHTIPINTVYDAFMHTLNPVFKRTKPDITEENLQARIRGTLLMALSNKMGSLVLSTSNKSEAAVGYSTLYGDMAGGFCPIKDVYKTIVYQLAHYRNQQSPVIPTRVIDRPPSAELAPNQKDEDTLPAYAILDQILEQFIDQEKTVPDIIKAGFNQEIVYKVAKMIQRSEYKRWQAAPGIRITEKAFGKDWRYPVTSAFEERGLRE